MDALCSMSRRGSKVCSDLVEAGMRVDSRVEVWDSVDLGGPSVKSSSGSCAERSPDGHELPERVFISDSFVNGLVLRQIRSGALEELE